MSIVRDQTLKDQTVELDGQQFINCHFEGGELIYRGGEPPRFEACTFQAAVFTFAGPALHIIALLRMMAPAHTNMRQIVLGLIPELQD